MIEWSHTKRGFKLGEFKDLYGADCSVQESSSAAIPAIWLGMDEGTHIDDNCLARMHLSQAQAEELIPILQHFVEMGTL